MPKEASEKTINLTKDKLRDIIAVTELEIHDSTYSEKELDDKTERLMKRLNDPTNYYMSDEKPHQRLLELWEGIVDTKMSFWNRNWEKKERKFLQFAKSTIRKRLLRYYLESLGKYVERNAMPLTEPNNSFFNHDVAKVNIKDDILFLPGWIDLSDKNINKTYDIAIEIISRLKRIIEIEKRIEGEHNTFSRAFNNKKFYYLKVHAVMEYLLMKPTSRQRSMLKDMLSIDATISRSLVWDYYDCYHTTSRLNKHQSFTNSKNVEDTFYGELRVEADHVLDVMIESIKQGKLKFSVKFMMLRRDRLEILMKKLKHENNSEINTFKKSLEYFLNERAKFYISLIDDSITRQEIRNMLDLEEIGGWDRVKLFFREFRSGHITVNTEGKRLEYKSGYTYNPKHPEVKPRLRHANQKITEVEKKLKAKKESKAKKELELELREARHDLIRVKKEVQETAAFRIWKVLASFLNTDGGTLIIGIPDDRSKTITGINEDDEINKLKEVHPKDFKENLKKANFEDVFSQHLNNLLFGSKKNEVMFDKVKDLINFFPVTMPYVTKSKERHVRRLLWFFEVTKKQGGSFSLSDPTKKEKLFFIRDNADSKGLRLDEYQEWKRTNDPTVV